MSDFARSPMGRALPFALLLVVGIGARVLQLPANFSPTAALVLFAAFHFRQPLTAVTLGVLTLAVSDLLIGVYEPLLMVFVYVAMVLPAVLGRWLRRRFSVSRLGAATVGGSTLFFVVSNFGVWATSGWYGDGLAGLVSCYIAALPFFQHTLIGDLFWVGIVFGSWYLLTRPLPRQAAFH